jgi:GT2 family glycosyltransferase
MKKPKSSIQKQRMEFTKVAAVIVSYNEKTETALLIRSLRMQSHKNIDILLVDNSSKDGTVAYIRKNFPAVVVIQNKENVGFARAANQGMKYVFKKNYDFTLVLNSDLIADGKMVKELLSTYRHFSPNLNIGMIQPVLLIQGTDLINSSGNPIHYLGFGYAGNYKKKLKSLPNIDKVVSSVPGGAMMITKKFYKEVGFFDESFFMYCEDQDLSWRGLLRGYTYLLSRKALLYHQYHFNKGKRKLYYYERNRFRMLLKNYSARTLILILPVLLVTEILMLGYSILNGWIHYKFWAYFSSLISLPSILEKRARIQKNRVVWDKDIVAKMVGRLDFSLVGTNKVSLASRLVNSLFVNYLGVLRRFI